MKSFITILISLTLFQSYTIDLVGQDQLNNDPNKKQNNFKIVSGNSSVTIPFKLNRGHIILQVEINGKNLNLTLDNGNVKAPTILYGSPKIDSLKLDYSGNALVGGAGDGEMPTAKVAENITLNLPDIKILKQTAIVMDYNPELLKAFNGEDGVLGAAIWDNFIVEIDFEKNVVVIAEPEKFNYIGKGEELPVDYFADGSSNIPGKLTLLDGTKISTIFNIDIGSPIALSLYLDKNVGIKKPEKTIEQKGFGAQGVFIEYVGRITSIQLGKYVINKVLTSFTSKSSLPGIGTGSIGNELFRRFNVTFDYHNNKIYLEPNSYFKDAFEFNMSGLGLMKTDDGNYRIGVIIPDSPASEVDLQVDDMIVEINGRLSGIINRDELDRLLRKDGEILSLEILRGGNKKSISLKLKRLI